VKRFVLYVNVSDMPPSMARKYALELVDILKEDEVVEQTDKISALCVYKGDTRLELISDDDDGFLSRFGIGTAEGNKNES
jgi:hypothetical protein